MNPKLCKRFGLSTSTTTSTTTSAKGATRSVSIGNEDEIQKTSARDAALLLSIADICNAEIKTGGLNNLWKDDLTLPRFPCLSIGKKESKNNYDQDDKPLAPRTSSMLDFMPSSGTDIYSSATRLRSVSIDSPNPTVGLYENRDAPSSPVSLFPPASSLPLVTPLQSRTTIRVQDGGRRRSSLGSLHSRSLSESSTSSTEDLLLSSPSSPRRTKDLQGPTPPGLAIKRIHRKKFSWKNYPELEQFLIANREEYLRHSALNYTIQQKQYNNRLTDRLLELATDNGYIFDEEEFNFVTVRDRIRCYFKSYVQSAKKRGILMGYAARKAGLLTEQDLEAGKAGRIITP